MIGEKVISKRMGLAMNKIAIYCRVSTEGQEQCPKWRSPYGNKPKWKWVKKCL